MFAERTFQTLLPGVTFHNFFLLDGRDARRRPLHVTLPTSLLLNIGLGDSARTQQKKAEGEEGMVSQAWEEVEGISPPGSVADACLISL